MDNDEKSSACPDESILDQFMFGTLPDDEQFEAIAVHLEHCDDCLRKLLQQELLPDPYVDSIRQLADQVGPSRQIGTNRRLKEVLIRVLKMRE